jgi:hypothetical protein
MVLAEMDADPAFARALFDRLAPFLPPPAAPDDGWMSMDEAAAYLGMTPNALHKYTRERTIRFGQRVRGGKCWFLRSDLDAFRRGEGRP